MEELVHELKEKIIETLNLEEIEKEVIEKAMRRCNGNISQAAELLGISRYSLYRKIEKNIQF